MLMLFATPLRLISVVVPVVLELAKLDDVSVVLDQENADWLQESALSISTSLLMTVLAGLTLNHALRKRRKAIGWFQAFVTANMVLNVAVTLFEAVAAREQASRSSPFGALVWPLIITLAWLKYFQSDPRVRETFVR